MTEKTPGICILCGILCCPPLPSSIANKLAFLPPANVSYSFSCFTDGKLMLNLSEKAFFSRSGHDIKKIKPFFVDTLHHTKIACLYFDINSNPSYNIVYSHGNAVEIGMLCNYMIDISRALGCNFVVYDYSGYGISNGSPSEQAINSDIESLYSFLLSKMNFVSEKIILYGQSIGSVPTVHLASKIQCAGVILHSAIASGLRIPFPRLKSNIFFDVFNNLKKITMISSPTLYIHGVKDEIVAFDHALTLYEKSINKVDPLWLYEAGHNDIELFEEYHRRLKKFVQIDLSNT